ncbi:Gfo/Idh/MocA family oxidoreductase [Pelomonas sp. SE-A7]|uniref:Gfo/Idh/MocA family protein n=1 Tax=Pelomonas sp. SE-A7 TaxID=3054953 RepID=UPI00259C9F30|nr:Gfo/Idh/MocA family oxidoreductase [Pelomonas sp. SE-A7]MDM4768445.1 Gfo/Idh/MocA family oxidoreductase [Pelomonas sp. SE-A7]
MAEAPRFGWGLVGPGRIANRFAEALGGIAGARLHLSQARDTGKAAAFAERWGGGVTASLDQLLSDPGVDAVYIATPHALHGDAIRACLLAGKPVLCEKPLVPSLAAAEPLLQLASERGVFLMEAMWTRFLPAYQQLAQWLAEGAIGELRGLQSSFCFPAPYSPENRCFAPELAGGALLDIGIYNLAATRFVLEQAFGQCPEPDRIETLGRLAPTGVDAQIAASLVFEDLGLASQFVCSFDAVSDNALVIQGTRGQICLPRDFWQATALELRVHGQAAERVEAPFRVNGFEYEIEEAMACIRAGRQESPRMPQAETRALLRWMDRIRAQVGVRYPFETEPSALSSF